MLRLGEAAQEAHSVNQSEWGDGTIAAAARRGVGWNAAGSVARLGLGLALNVVLARLLGPRPFGLVAAALLPVGIATLLVEGGLSAGLIQREDITEDDVGFVHAVQTLMGLILAGLIVILAPTLSAFFKAGGLTPVARLISIVVVMQAVSQAPTALLRRRFKFRQIQTANIASYLVGYGFIGVPSAFAGLGVYSVVLAQVSQSALRATLLMAYSGVGVVFRVRGRPALLGFGSQLLGANLANWVLSNADTAFIGHSFPPESLGYYNRAMYLAAAPVGVVARSVQSVLFPAVSRLAQRREEVRRVYLMVLRLTAVAALPLFGWLFGAGPVLVGVVLGPRWHGAAVLMPALSVAMALNVLLSLAGPLISGLGEARVELRQTMLALIVALPLLAVGAAISVEAVAWAVAGARFVFLVLLTSPLRRLAGIGAIDMLKAVAPAFALGVSEAVGVRITLHVLSVVHVAAGVTLAAVLLAGLIVGIVWMLVLGGRVFDRHAIKALGLGEDNLVMRIVGGVWKGHA